MNGRQRPAPAAGLNQAIGGANHPGPGPFDPAQQGGRLLRRRARQRTGPGQHGFRRRHQQFDDRHRVDAAPGSPGGRESAEANHRQVPAAVLVGTGSHHLADAGQRAEPLPTVDGQRPARTTGPGPAPPGRTGRTGTTPSAGPAAPQHLVGRAVDQRPDPGDVQRRRNPRLPHPNRARHTVRVRRGRRDCRPDRCGGSGPCSA